MLFEAAAGMLEGKWKLDLTTYTGEQVALIEGCLRGRRSPVGKPSAQVIAELQQSLLLEAEAHARAREPLPARERPIEEMPVSDPGEPLPSSRAPAVRPRPAEPEVLPPVPRHMWGGSYERERPVERFNGGCVRSWRGTPWDDGR
jgi:hypothetical protein